MIMPHARNALIAVAGSLAFNLLLFMLLPVLVRNPEAELRIEPTAPVQVRSVETPAPLQRPEQPRSMAKAPEPRSQALIPLEVSPQLSKQMQPQLALPQPLNHVALPDLDLAPIDLDAVSRVEVGTVPEFYAAEDLDQPVHPVAQTPFMYPLRAKRKGIEGWVRVAMLVDVQGQVEGVEIIRAEPEGVFEETVLRGLRSWRFSPATVAGERVKTRVVTTIRFELED